VQIWLVGTEPYLFRLILLIPSLLVSCWLPKLAKTGIVGVALVGKYRCVRLTLENDRASFNRRLFSCAQRLVQQVIAPGRGGSFHKLIAPALLE
jgi:hypothetical protein